MTIYSTSNNKKERKERGREREREREGGERVWEVNNKDKVIS